MQPQKHNFVGTHKIVKETKTFSDGEFVKDCMAAVANIICPESKNKSENISLPRTTVVRHIEAISQDLTNQHCVNIKSFHWIWILNILTLLYHTNVHWLSLGSVEESKAFNGIIMFPEMKDTTFEFST